MKYRLSPILLVILMLLTGCASPPEQGPAYGRHEEFLQQLSATVPMKDYGYTIKMLRFSDDFQEVLVVFTHADAKSRPDWEFILKEDEFGRYRGMSMQPFYTPGTANTPPIQITVELTPK